MAELDDGADPIGTEIEVLREEMRDHGSRYWREPERQERYRSLIESRESGSPVPAVRQDSAEPPNSSA